jgi:hypothetical protein
MKTYSKGLLPTHQKDGQWGFYRKKITTQAMRIVGKFKVITREGELVCSDGYLALDASGYPYPIESKEFDKLYEVA